ncbi:hypothetical protein JD844_002770 [Phrynosoma platyrhinos]|uniref:Uncharacterized protein n=1 Tax=Phrynosoma platyrhinos TaxID=52577 RepID=A0ABQ7TCN5_PHRPL|nr:hypothetical protein JD844_002770 [Phrynosoma platyrhinos]
MKMKQELGGCGLPHCSDCDPPKQVIKRPAADLLLWQSCYGTTGRNPFLLSSLPKEYVKDQISHRWFKAPGLEQILWSQKTMPLTSQISSATSVMSSCLHKLSCPYFSGVCSL